MPRDYGFRTINGSTTLVTVPASATLNNRSIGTWMVVCQTNNISPPTQRNLVSKSSGANLNGVLHTASGWVFQYGGGSGGGQVVMNLSATQGNMPGLQNNRPIVFAVTYSHGVSGSLYAGLVGQPLVEPTTYAARVLGTMGVVPHDDSASALGLCATPAGANVIDGFYWSIQFWGEVLPLDVLQQRARDYNPVNTLGSWRFGPTGLGVVLDDSGHGGHAPVTSTSSPVLASDTPLVHRRGVRWDPMRDERAIAAVPPSATETASLFVSTPA